MAYDLQQTSFIMCRNNYLLYAIYVRFVFVSLPIFINNLMIFCHLALIPALLNKFGWK